MRVMIRVWSMLDEGIVLGQIQSVRSRLIKERPTGECHLYWISDHVHGHRKVGGEILMRFSATYANQDSLPSSSTSSKVRENTFYAKDREVSWWPHPEDSSIPGPSTVSPVPFQSHSIPRS